MGAHNMHTNCRQVVNTFSETTDTQNPPETTHPSSTRPPDHAESTGRPYNALCASTARAHCWGYKYPGARVCTHQHYITGCVRACGGDDGEEQARQSESVCHHRVCCSSAGAQHGAYCSQTHAYNTHTHTHVQERTFASHLSGHATRVRWRYCVLYRDVRVCVVCREYRDARGVFCRHSMFACNLYAQWRIKFSTCSLCVRHRQSVFACECLRV